MGDFLLFKARKQIFDLQQNNFASQETGPGQRKEKFP